MRVAKMLEGKLLLTQQPHSPAEEPHIPSCHIQQHNGEQCSYSYPEHQPLLQPQEGLVHTSPVIIVKETDRQASERDREKSLKIKLIHKYTVSVALVPRVAEVFSHYQ